MGALFMIGATVGWGLLGTFSRIALAEGVSPTAIAFWRCLLAGGVFAVFALAQRRQVPRHDSLRIALFGLIGITAMYIGFFVAVERVGPSLAVILLYTGPVWVAVYQTLFRRLPPSRAQTIALAMAIFALAGVSGFANERLDAIGLIAGIVSGASFATHFVYASTYIARYGGVAVFARALLVAAALMLPFLELPAGTTAWATLIAAAAISTVVPSLLFALAINQLAPVTAATIATFEPVVGLIAAHQFFGERLTSLQYVAAAVLILALILSVQYRSE